MHELGIAESILTAVRTELASHPGAKPVRVGLRIGEFAAVDPASLRFCFEAVTIGTAWHPLALDIESTPATDELDFSFLELENP
jgi:hydrogenase nickel incorporation protein HypA/HybF